MSNAKGQLYFLINKEITIYAKLRYGSSCYAEIDLTLSFFLNRRGSVGTTSNLVINSSFQPLEE